MDLSGCQMARLKTLLIVLALGIGLSQAGAAPARAKMVGMVLPKDCPIGADGSEVVSSYLYKHGFSHSSLEVLIQKPSPDKLSRLNSIRKFLAYGVDVLLVWGGTAIPEALKESGKVPIIFIGAYDPLRQGLVKDMNKPGGSTTGVSGNSSLAFLIDNIKTVTGSAEIGVIYHSDNLDSVTQLAELREMAGKKGLKIAAVDAKGADIESVSKEISGAPILFQTHGCAVAGGKVEVLSGLGKPVATQTPGLTGPGVVFSLASDPKAMFQEAAKITERVLKGEKPGQIPVVRLKKIDFTINLKEARNLGIKVPFTVLSKGTRIIK